MDDSVPKKSLTSQDLDMDLMAEAELTRLQRQVKFILKKSINALWD